MYLHNIVLVQFMYLYMNLSPWPFLHPTGYALLRVVPIALISTANAANSTHCCTFIEAVFHHKQISICMDTDNSTAYLYINIITSGFHSWRNWASRVARGGRKSQQQIWIQTEALLSHSFLLHLLTAIWILWAAHLPFTIFSVQQICEFFQSRLCFPFVDTNCVCMCNCVESSVHYKMSTLYMMPPQNIGNAVQGFSFHIPWQEPVL